MMWRWCYLSAGVWLIEWFTSMLDKISNRLSRCLFFDNLFFLTNFTPSFTNPSRINWWIDWLALLLVIITSTLSTITHDVWLAELYINSGVSGIHWNGKSECRVARTSPSRAGGVPTVRLLLWIISSKFFITYIVAQPPKQPGKPCQTMSLTYVDYWQLSQDRREQTLRKSQGQTLTRQTPNSYMHHHI